MVHGPVYELMYALVCGLLVRHERGRTLPRRLGPIPSLLSLLSLLSAPLSLLSEMTIALEAGPAELWAGRVRRLRGVVRRSWRELDAKERPCFVPCDCEPLLLLLLLLGRA